jgi:hypothetical protein
MPRSCASSWPLAVFTRTITCPAIVGLDGKRRDIAAAHRIELLDRPFDVLRPDVAAVQQDQILARR